MLMDTRSNGVDVWGGIRACGVYGGMCVMLHSFLKQMDLEV